MELTQQLSKTECRKPSSGRHAGPAAGKEGHYGCVAGGAQMWVDGGCRGVFTCDGVSGVACGSEGRVRVTCDCKPKQQP